MIGEVGKLIFIASAAAIMSGDAVMASAKPPISEHIAPQQSTVAPSPISTSELQTQISPGLGCTFTGGNDILFVVTVGEALVKPNGVLTHFDLDEDRSLSLINFGGSIGNRELRVIVDRDEQATTGEETTIRSARLTLRFRGAEKNRRGQLDLRCLERQPGAIESPE